MADRKAAKNSTRKLALILCCAILLGSTNVLAFAHENGNESDIASSAIQEEANAEGLEGDLMEPLPADNGEPHVARTEGAATLSEETRAAQRTIVPDSVELSSYLRLIDKVDDKTYNVSIPGVTAGTPLPYDVLVGEMGGFSLKAVVEDASGAEESISLTLNGAEKFEWQVETDESGNLLIGGQHTILIHFPQTNWKDVAFDDGTSTATINLFVGTIPGDDSRFDSHRIQTVSPENVNFTLFDYWIGDQTAHDHVRGGLKDPATSLTCGILRCAGETTVAGDVSAGSPFYNSGINADHAFTFGPSKLVGEWNAWTGVGDAARTGIVRNTLTDGYPVLNLSQDKVDTVDVLRDRPAGESLQYLFSPDEFDGKAVYENVNGLLKIDPDTSNYKYSSLENFASYSEESGQFDVYEIPVDAGASSGTGQFFPFNKPSQVFEYKENGDFAAKSVSNETSAFINHYFGMTLDVDFQQPPHGKVSNGANAKDMVFTFTGDDDIWIFIDDVLVVDMGGIHDAMSVEINFATGDIKIDRKDRFSNTTSPTRTLTTLKDQFTSAGQDANFDFDGNTFADNTVHELRMFYLERGNFASNLEFSFNLMEHRFSNIMKVDQDGKGLDGIVFDVYEADGNFQATGDAIARLTTNDRGYVDLAEDVNGKKNPIVFDQDKKYVLREVKTKDGFVTTGDVHLEYDDQTSTLNLVNQWDTGATAGFEAYVTQSGDLWYATGDKANDAGQEGLIVAVPFFNSEHKGSSATDGWRPMYGSVSEGFHVVDVKATDDEGYRAAALEAVMRQLYNPEHEDWYLEYNQSLMRFEGRLIGLPGAANRYIFINPTEGDMLTAYYLLTPTDNTFDGCTTAKEKYEALYRKMVDATAEGEDAIRKFVEAQRQNMKRLNLDGFDRQFYTRLYVPNQVRELRIHKQDTDKIPLAGAEFTLYEDSACTIAVAKGVTDNDGNLSFSAQNTGNNGVGNSELSSKVYFPFMRLGEVGSRENRSYWLKETAAPEGHKPSETVSEVRVTKDSIYVNAGSADDGVAVRKGAGKLLQTMMRYAADDKLNVTLRDILVTMYVQDASIEGKDLKEFKDWSPVADEPALSLHFGLEGALMDYGLHDKDRKPYFEVDEGWIGFGVEQNYEAHSAATGDEWSKAGGVKEDLRTEDISALLTGTTTVVVTNEKASETVDPTPDPMLDPDDPDRTDEPGVSTDPGDSNEPVDSGQLGDSDQPGKPKPLLFRVPQTGDSLDALVLAVLLVLFGAAVAASLSFRKARGRASRRSR